MIFSKSCYVNWKPLDLSPKPESEPECTANVGEILLIWRIRNKAVGSNTTELFTLKTSGWCCDECDVKSRCWWQELKQMMLIQNIICIISLLHDFLTQYWNFYRKRLTRVKLWISCKFVRKPRIVKEKKQNFFYLIFQLWCKIFTSEKLNPFDTKFWLWPERSKILQYHKSFVNRIFVINSNFHQNFTFLL